MALNLFLIDFKQKNVVSLELGKTLKVFSLNVARLFSFDCHSLCLKALVESETT